MSAILDGLIALWVISGLITMVIAIGRGRSALPWVLLATLIGPIALAVLIRKGPLHPDSVDRGLCAECFARLTDDNRLCPRCR